MQRVDLNKPGEKKKIIVAAALGLVAIVFIWWVLFGFGGGGTPTTVRTSASPTPQRVAQKPGSSSNQVVSPAVQDFAAFTEVRYQRSSYDAPEARRNIFAYYEPPP